MKIEDSELRTLYALYQRYQDSKNVFHRLAMEDYAEDLYTKYKIPKKSTIDLNTGEIILPQKTIVTKGTPT